MDFKKILWRAGVPLMTLAASVSASTLDFTDIKATVGNATELVFYVMGLFLDGIAAVIPKMFSPLILLAILTAIIVVIGLISTLMYVIVGAFKGAMGHKAKKF